jgi:drug/metabolite transporter (DMT)-like permease
MLSKNQLGFLYMFLCICAFSIMDVLVKWSDNYPLGQVLFFRGFFGIIFYIFLIPKNRIKNFYYTKRKSLHFLRCLAGIISLIAIFIALRKLPLATVVSISFATPIFTTIFSILFLSEKVGIYRWMAVMVGFVGIIVIAEPGIAELNIYYFFPIIFCLGLSYVAIAIRTTFNYRAHLVNLFLFSLSITISIFGILQFLLVGIVPSLGDLILLSMIGLSGGVANLWLGQSYKYAEVSLVTPFKIFGFSFCNYFLVIYFGKRFHLLKLCLVLY